MKKRFSVAALLALGLSTSALAQTVDPASVRAHEEYLAGDALRGRGSATPDEAKAADYVAAQFKAFGLKPAPGMDGYLQKADILRPRLDGAPVLSAGGAALPGAALLMGSGKPVSGALTIYKDKDGAKVPAGDVVLADSKALKLLDFLRSDASDHVKLLIVRESDDSAALLARFGGHPRMGLRLQDATGRDGVSIVTLPRKAFDTLAKQSGAQVSLTLPGLASDTLITTNAIGYLPGTDPAAGVLLLTAHLDHLGVKPDGTVMPGANDDASGTTAVLELAHALAGGKPMRRGILFVAYGSEEMGGYGSRYFGEHPPVPLTSIAANIEIEMIGAQDPKLPAGYMMMTGFERSNLGEMLKAQGALVTADPYPDQHFFQRSDNYQLALKGVVAHTIGGWAMVPTYHSPTDTVANLDIPFMARAIQSLIGPLRSLADSDFKPDWKPGGKPE